MTFSDLFVHEWKTRLSRPAALMFFALFAAALVYGAINGRLQRDAHVRTIATHRAEIAEKMAGWLRDLRILQAKGSTTDVPPWAGSAMDVTFATYLSPAPLADFAVGQSDLLPQVGAVSLWNPDVRQFAKYEFDDPVSLALGAFDLSKGIVFLLPLLLIVLCFDALSGDRDTNRLGLVLAQGARVRKLIWVRLVIRAGVAMGLTFVIALSALVVPVSNIALTQRLSFFLLWLLCILLYGVFWVAIIGFVVGRNRRGEVNVLLLLIAWTGFNLVLPASVAAVAEAVFPSPSRLAYLAQARETEIRTERTEAEVTHGFVIDHPEMVIDAASQIPAYVRTAFLVTRAVDAATGPVRANFDEMAARRDETLSLLRFVSPAIIVHGLCNEIAGTSSTRHRRFAAEARALKSAYAGLAGPYIVAGQRLSPEAVASLPVFHLEDETPATVFRRSGGAFLFLTLAASLLLYLADRRLRCVGGLDLAA